LFNSSRCVRILYPTVCPFLFHPPFHTFLRVFFFFSLFPPLHTFPASRVVFSPHASPLKEYGWSPSRNDKILKLLPLSPANSSRILDSLSPVCFTSHLLTSLRGLFFFLLVSRFPEDQWFYFESIPPFPPRVLSSPNPQLYPMPPPPLFLQFLCW